MSSQPAAARRIPILGRYGAIFAHAWRERHRSTVFLMKADEADFSPPALALTQRPVSPTARLTAALLVGLVAITLVWATLGRLDMDATAVGQAIPSARTKTVASVDTAVVRAIYVKEGQSVKAGQVLVTLDAGPLRADYRKALAQEHAAELDMARSSALIASIATHRIPQLGSLAGISVMRLREAQGHLASQYLDFTTRLAQLDADIDRYVQALPVAQERERIYARLVQTHDVSRDDWLTKEQQLIEIEGQLADAKDARAAFVAHTRLIAFDTFTDAAKAAATAREEAAGSAAHAAWLTLRSPVDGTVQQLAVHTVGGVVAAAQPLMLVVPAGDQVVVQAYLANKDVGFVKEGQSAQVKVAAFDYTKYGTIPGRVVSVSREAIDADDSGQEEADTRNEQSRYLVRVALRRSTMRIDGQVRHLLPGMAVTVEIRTGKRRVIEYFLSPLLRQGSESLHER